MSAVMAPPGWGWKAGVPMFATAVERLPDLPLLDQLPRFKRPGVILDALKQTPDIIRDLFPRDLVNKYGIPQPTASELLNRARG